MSNFILLVYQSVWVLRTKNNNMQPRQKKVTVNPLKVKHYIYLFTATQPNYTDCQRRYIELSKNPVSGQYIPWCRPDGGYYWRQCYGSYCFCVDQYGREVTKTRVYSSNGTPKCSKDGKDKFPFLMNNPCTIVPIHFYRLVYVHTGWRTLFCYLCTTN